MQADSAVKPSYVCLVTWGESVNLSVREMAKVRRLFTMNDIV